MSSGSWSPEEIDELDRRYRSLEAERLRPVSRAVPAGNTTMRDDLEAIERRRAVLEALENEDEEGSG